MRRFVELTMILVFSAAMAAGQSNANQDYKQYEEQETLRQLEKGIFFARIMPTMVGKRIMQALVPDLSEVLAPDYIFIDARGQVITKTQELERFNDSAATPPQTFGITDSQVQTSGDMAVVRSTFKLDKPYDYELYPTGDYRVISIYMKRSGKWLLTLSQWTRIADEIKQEEIK